MSDVVCRTEGAWNRRRNDEGKLRTYLVHVDGDDARFSDDRGQRHVDRKLSQERQDRRICGSWRNKTGERGITSGQLDGSRRAQGQAGHTGRK